MIRFLNVSLNMQIFKIVQNLLENLAKKVISDQNWNLDLLIDGFFP